LIKNRKNRKIILFFNIYIINKNKYILMKYLKRFENFDLGRFSETEEDKIENQFSEVEEVEDDCATCGDDYDEFDDKFIDSDFEEEEQEEEESEMRRRVWGDELVEGLTAKQKKLPKALQDAILKKKGKKVEDKKEEDKKDKKEDKKEESKKGLTAAQKKLPKALQDAILKKQK
jgi:hypothetical protein